MTSRLLHGTVEMPLIGLGTYKSTPAELKVAIPEAIQCGYRLFDTATVYRNEEAVGEYLRAAMAEHGLTRKDVFVTSKLAPADQGFESTLRAVAASLTRLKMEYIDLYLIHWPGTSRLGDRSPKHLVNRRESWRALEQLHHEGKLRAIGVSNYLERHLVEMRDYAKIMPSVNQFELHPGYYPAATVAFCEQNNVFIQTYSSLGEGVLLEERFLTRHPEIRAIAERHGVSVAQVLLKWPLQHGWGIIPKSVHPERIRANITLDFTLSSDDMRILDQFHVKESFKTSWDPEQIA